MPENNPMVEVIHHVLGLVKVKKNYRDLVLTVNHIERGGAYCSVKELDRYFEQISEDVRENIKKPSRRKVVKKVEAEES